ncbi:MAG: sigma 54-dependent Fis family transcriptional regulator [Myxococcales bacterium FL481]|nr:MAG: sigma 54-dependent Fis family transcriptional regulator [Myxococcales bacterium FL481]
MADKTNQRTETGMTTVFRPAQNHHTRVRQVVLRVKSGPDKGLQIEVARQRVTVGRSAVNDLVLTDTAVSGTHLEIGLGEKEILLRDHGSTNGTLVNGIQIKEAWIEPGMTIGLGKTEIVFLSADEIEVPLSAREQFGALYGQSACMREVFAVLERVAPTDMTVLIGGETGTGKELVARAIHDASPRNERPFVVLDCGAIPRDLAEASIFGHKKGSFTGAVDDRAGAFEQASSGTLFLDEVGELPLDLQPKLLRALDRQEVTRIGETQPRRVDVRIVAATHRDLRHMVGQGHFREDLYFRLSVMEVVMPPLRERGEDVLYLAERFLEEFARAGGRRLTLDDSSRRALMSETWAGNVRQLRNVIERAAHLARKTAIEPSDLHLGLKQSPSATRGATAPSQIAAPAVDEARFAEPFKDAKQIVIDAFEREYFSRLLARTSGNLSRAAAEAGITRYYLRELLKRLGLREPAPRP